MSTSQSVTALARQVVSRRLSIAAIALVYLFAVTGSPEMVRGWSNHDDLHFLRMASSVLSEGWFGPYDQMTLMKGPTYPLFLAFNFVLGLPLLLTSQLIYLAACYFMARAIALYGVSDWGVVFIFALLVLHPIAFTPEMFAVLRTSLYLSLTIASCAAWLAIPQLVRQYRTTKAIMAAVAGGFCFAAFWMLREEGIWIVPALVLLLGGNILVFWRRQRMNLLRSYAAALSVFCLTF